ncbi:MAG: helix-turn-helix transcriptional regulator [Bacteroidetes bacterium]|nr:helix-turn-helix transcriptional regulator [Bacteroidota bacterium]
MGTKDIKFKSFDKLKDKYIGELGTDEREQYEFDLKLDILGEMIKKARKERNLTQEQLGELVGVKKSEISKLERNARNMTISTVLRIFKTLKANVKFIVELENIELNIAS